MKTLHITNAWHESSGGIATFYRALMAEANRRGQSMRLVVPGEADRVEECGACCRIHYLRSPRAPMNSGYRILYPSQFLLAGSKLQSLLAGERPDLVEICDKYTLNYLAGLLRQGLMRGLNFRPVVVGLSCERMDDNVRSYLGSWPASASISLAYMKRLYFPMFDFHVANSLYTAEELRRASIQQLTPRSVWVRPMGVDFNLLSPARKAGELRRQLVCEVGGTSENVPCPSLVGDEGGTHPSTSSGQALTTAGGTLRLASLAQGRLPVLRSFSRSQGERAATVCGSLGSGKESRALVRDDGASGEYLQSRLPALCSWRRHGAQALGAAYGEIDSGPRTLPRPYAGS